MKVSGIDGSAGTPKACGCQLAIYLATLLYTGFVRILEKSGKCSGNFQGLEKSGK